MRVNIGEEVVPTEAVPRSKSPKIMRWRRSLESGRESFRAVYEVLRRYIGRVGFAGSWPGIMNYKAPV